MKAIYYFNILIITTLVSCGNGQKNTQTSTLDNKLLMAVSWYQNSAEMTALYYQGFNIAKISLDESIKSNKQKKPLALVVDIDETMLDNSPFETTLFSKVYALADWYKWTSLGTAKALPGALEFVKYAKSQLVDVFYITNRDDNERVGTLKNLVNLGFPNADENHLLTRSEMSESSGSTGSKEGRRAKVSESHEIVLLIGDNLNDFSQVFEDRSINYGKDAVEKNKDIFGKKFIMLPNPMYGAWEKPLLDYKHGLDENEKSRLLISKLRKD